MGVHSYPRSNGQSGSCCCFFFNDTATTEIYTLSLHDALPIYPMFGRGLTRLQPAYVEDVAEAIGRVMQRAETPSTIFEFGGPRVYSYEEFLRAVAQQAGLSPRLIPIPFDVWLALTWVSKMLPRPGLTRNQVELMQIDTVS